MDNLLLQLDTDKHPSAFDTIVAYDAGADHVLAYGNVVPGDVRGLVYGVMFTRGGSKLRHSAIFIGGSDVVVGEQLLAEATAAFFGPVRVSVMLDSNGSNTTAAAAVLKLLSVTDVEGQRAVVLAGTGPVGYRAAMLLALEGAEVVLTSRRQERAEEAARRLETAGVHVTPLQVNDSASTARVLEGASVLVAAGTAGVPLVSQAQWSAVPTLRAMADVNAVPPVGIEGVKPNDDGVERAGVIAFGALGVGGLKMKIHKACIARLFEQNDFVLDTRAIYEVGKQLLQRGD
ncbi:MAG TPA: methylenetetrahydromethanopterin dehydrogenase [Chloroflexi bacterium]|nr:methylenetetrahydromethanopterin dehydrogenase [Chloroflexota bacterium]